MGAKLAVAAVSALLGAGALLYLSSGPMPRDRPQPPPAEQEPSPPSARVQPPPPMFSPWYAEALNGVLELEESDRVRLEERLAAHADDFPARLQLMAYHHRADRTANPEDRAKRLRHVLWLIERHPESEILHSYVAQFEPGQLTAADYRRALSLWEAAAAAQPANAPALWNAANFFQNLDPALHLRYLEATAAAEPNHPHALRPLAHLYARSIAAGDSLAGHARAALEASSNVWVVGNAAHYLQMVHNQRVQTGVPAARLAELAERYFLRAQALDPNLDRQTILPQIDREAVRRAQESTAEMSRKLAARFEEGVRTMRRLPVDALPELPPSVAAALKARASPYSSPRHRRRLHRQSVRGLVLSPGQVGDAPGRRLTRAYFFAFAAMSACNTSTAFRICASRPAAKSGGRLSTKTSGGTP
jgi:hypothetical protein